MVIDSMLPVITVEVPKSTPRGLSWTTEAITANLVARPRLRKGEAFDATTKAKTSRSEPNELADKSCKGLALGKSEPKWPLASDASTGGCKQRHGRPSMYARRSQPVCHTPMQAYGCTLASGRALTPMRRRPNSCFGVDYIYLYM